MSTIISVLIEFLNSINKIIWKFIIFLSKFIKVDDVITSNKPTDEKYKQFKVDDSPLIEPFVKMEHKVRIIKSSLKKTTLNLLTVAMVILLFQIISNALVALLLKIIFMIILVNKINLNVKFVIIFFLIILTNKMMLF